MQKLSSNDSEDPDDSEETQNQEEENIYPPPNLDVLRPETEIYAEPDPKIDAESQK